MTVVDGRRRVAELRAVLRIRDVATKKPDSVSCLSPRPLAAGRVLPSLAAPLNNNSWQRCRHQSMHRSFFSSLMLAASPAVECTQSYLLCTAHSALLLCHVRRLRSAAKRHLTPPPPPPDSPHPSSHVRARKSWQRCIAWTHGPATCTPTAAFSPLLTPLQCSTGAAHFYAIHPATVDECFLEQFDALYPAVCLTQFNYQYYLPITTVTNMPKHTTTQVCDNETYT